MKPIFEELEHIAVEMSQQDWSDLRFADVYYDAFVAGGKWFMRSYERLEKERDELAALNQRMRETVGLIANWNSHTTELAVNHGSNGVRDFYRRIAESSLSEQPPAALAALKAQWQAEGAIAAWVALNRTGMAKAGSKNVFRSLLIKLRRTQEAGDGR